MVDRVVMGESGQEAGCRPLEVEFKNLAALAPRQGRTGIQDTHLLTQFVSDNLVIPKFTSINSVICVPASSVWEMHRPSMLVSFRRCCQASTNALFAIKAKLNSQDGRTVFFETATVSFKTNGYTRVLA